MGIYIKDAKKPKDCNECWAVGLHIVADCKSAEWNPDGDKMPKDCPLEAVGDPNLILPERVERDEVYDVGETITVMNHEDYMEMFCKAMMWDAYGDKPRQGEWIDINAEESKARCSNCNKWSSFRGDF